MNLRGRSLTKELDWSRDEFLSVVRLAAELRQQKRDGTEKPCLVGRNVALIFEKTSTRTRSAFEVAAHDQGAHVTCLGPGESQLGRKESVKDTARVLGRMFDGIEFRGFSQDDAEALARFAGVPVWNGLTDQWHPTQMLADVLTMEDHGHKPLEQLRLCYVGDGRNNTANSLLITGALIGLDVRIAAPEALWPTDSLRQLAHDVSARSDAVLHVTEDVEAAVRGVDFVYTDVWVSMGDPESEWDERIDQLLPYQVNASLMEATGNPDVKFMHCLPALHDTATEIGAHIYEKRGLRALEVTDDVFESEASVVFDQAENRMHTIKALMVATLA